MKKPKIEKAPKEPKAQKEKKGKPPQIVALGSNSVDPDQQALFLADKNKWKRLNDAVHKATAARRSHEKSIKADGFVLDQIKFVVLCETPEGEAEAKSKIANNLLAARYAGIDIGAHLDLFMDDPRVAAVDRAYEEGKIASMENKAAVPSYDPLTEQFRSYMKGFHDHQAKLAKGITKLEKPTSAEMN